MALATPSDARTASPLPGATASKAITGKSAKPPPASSACFTNAPTASCAVRIGTPREISDSINVVAGGTIDAAIGTRKSNGIAMSEQKWVDATAQLLAEDSRALQRFMSGDMTIFTASQFNQLGGVTALARFDGREQVFEALRQSTLVRQSLLAATAQ